MEKEQKHPEYQYLDLMGEIMETGRDKGSLTSGERVRYVNSRTHRYDLNEGFPLLTTKDVFWKGVRVELQWLLSGETNLRFMVKNGVHIWDADCYKYGYSKAMKEGTVPNLSKEDFGQKLAEDDDFCTQWGELGPVYGKQWRAWERPHAKPVDQLDLALEKLIKEPERKHNVFTAWNPANIYENAPSHEEEMALAPCHMLSQLDVSEDGVLDLIMVQRSCDMFLGVPFNIASYALMTHLFAEFSDLRVGEFIHEMHNTHVYHKHFEAAKLQRTREPFPFPKLEFTRIPKDFDDFKWTDAKVVDYKHHPAIKAEMVTVGGMSGRIKRRT